MTLRNVTHHCDLGQKMGSTDMQVSWNVIASFPKTGSPRFRMEDGSAWGPVILPVFKTGGWQVFLSLVGSTPTRFRHLFSIS
jgi:hypothetical protein